jgi:hypothetical protein
MKQLNLQLKPIVQEEVPNSVNHALRGLDSAYFEFPGRINIECREGQFQYRFGVKIQPKDRRLNDTHNKTTHTKNNT